MTTSERPESEPSDVERARVDLERRTRRSFAVGAVAAASGLGAWAWLRNASTVGGLPWPIRRVLEGNQVLAESAFRSDRLAPTFPASLAKMPRVNGRIGLESPLDPADWRLRVLAPDTNRRLGEYGFDQLLALPRVEFTAELKCVEGWSTIVRWAGVRLIDFAAAFGFGTRDGAPPDPVGHPANLFRYVGFATPDREYYVGYDVASAFHPQTLLCYEMDGRPLSPEHGAPLRLFASVKYGYKLIKRIGTIWFSDRRPADFWAEQGYDWYAGH